MERANGSVGEPRGGTATWAVPMFVLVLMAMTIAGVALLAHSEGLSRAVTAWDAARFARGTERMMDRGLFLDFEDRVVLDEIPRVRRDPAGVYLFGTSAMKWATRMWDEPAAVRARVRNLGIGATNHGMQFQFIRHLVEQEGLLDAGPGRVHVVLGLYWSMALDWNPEGFFGPLWRRHGLYTYDRERGIDRVPMPAAERWWLAEQGRCAGLLSGTFNRAARLGATAAGMRLSETENIQGDQRVSEWARRLAGTDRYHETLDRQVALLSDLVTYLRGKGVRVTFVILPQRRAFDALDLPKAYRGRVLELASARDVPLVDISRLVNEDEFADMNHTNDAGLAKTHRALMDLARRRLEEMGISQ